MPVSIVACVTIETRGASVFDLNQISPGQIPGAAMQAVAAAQAQIAEAATFWITR
jgi:hypothetical protein